jgi:hypothetical protein
MKDATRMPALAQNATPSSGEAYATKEVTTRLQAVQTNKLIETSGGGEVTVDLFRQNQTPVSDNLKNQTALVSVQKPFTVVTFTRHENADPQGSTNEGHLGKTNSASFLGGLAGTWLFTGLTGTTNNGGQTFIVTYEFQSSEALVGGWETTLIYTDENTGLPIANPADNPPDDRTQRTYDTYDEYDFTLFKLEP